MNIYNFASWMAQIAVLVSIAAAAGFALKSAPRARLIFWQGVLALALLLPAIQPWPAPHASSDGVAISSGAVTIAGSARAGFHLEWHVEYLLWIAGAGAVLRMVWLGIGLARLRRLRLHARPLENPPVPSESARWYISETLSGPVTFGFYRPNILLPARFSSMAAEIQEAIACHELVHVQRHDWLLVVLEEFLRATFWFHPAMWFAIAKIQLAREQVVDDEVIRLTRDRERYLDALVAVAEQKFQPDLAPATLFLTKRHLAVRVAAILKERRMSKARIVTSFTTVATAALVAVRLAVWFFPLHSSAQTVIDVPDSPGVTVDAGAPLLHRAPVIRPSGVTATGTVLVESTLDSNGEVSDARVVSGPDELRRAALESVLQWHYANNPAPPQTVRATIQFGPASTTSAASANIGTAPGAPQAQPSSRFPARLRSINIEGTPPELFQKVLDALPVHVEDMVTEDSLRQILAAAQKIDEHFRQRVEIDSNNQVRVTLMLSPYTRAASATPPQRIRVGGNVQQANLVTKVAPVYPPDAKEARIQGVVRLAVTISKEGAVENIEVVSGEPMLVQSAMEAVKQWVYKPTLLNGNPVEVITTVDVNYTLSQ